MASPQGSSTRIHPSSSSPPPPPQPASGLEATTLFLSAVASAVSAYVTSKVWAAGTLWAAAMSPVIVALVKEGLRKPTDLVAAAVPSPRMRTRGAGDGTRIAPLPDDLPAQLGAGAPPPFPPPQPGAAEGPVRIYSTRGRRLRWRLALVTGLLGFVVCVLVYTVPEVIAGRSVVSSGHKTTLWGGSRHHRATTTTTTTTTTTPRAPQATTPARTVTVPAQTVTVPPPAATPPPAQTTPAPASPPQATTPQAPQPAAPQVAPGGEATPSG